MDRMCSRNYWEVGRSKFWSLVAFLEDSIVIGYDRCEDFFCFLDLVITYTGDDNGSGVSYTTCLSYRSYGYGFVFMFFFRVRVVGKGNR